MVTNIQAVKVWFVCPKCNNSRHRILPSEKAPYWWCQDEKISLREGDEVEIEDIEQEENDAS